jgi:hypothetical protein
MDKPSDNAAKMHKLRNAVERLRKFRKAKPAPQQKQTLLERLKARLGLGQNNNREESA